MTSSDLKDSDFRKRGRKRRPISGGSELGDLLATLRTEQGWTRITAAKESGVSDRIIAKLENGKLDTSISNLERYLNLFGFTLSAKRIEANPANSPIEAPTPKYRRTMPQNIWHSISTSFV